LKDLGTGKTTAKKTAVAATRPPKRQPGKKALQPDTRRYTMDNPSPAANSLAKYLRENPENLPYLEKMPEFTGRMVQGMWIAFNSWQRKRNEPGGEADQERAAAQAEREAQKAANAAARVANRQKREKEAAEKKAAREKAAAEKKAAADKAAADAKAKRESAAKARTAKKTPAKKVTKKAAAAKKTANRTAARVTATKRTAPAKKVTAPATKPTVETPSDTGKVATVTTLRASKRARRSTASPAPSEQEAAF